MSLVHADGFVYDNLSSEMFGLMMAYSESQEQFNTGLSLDVSQGETNFERYRPNYYGAKYKTQSLGYSFQIYKKDKTPFTIEESRAINRWLSQKEFKPLTFNDTKFGSNYVYYAIFTEIVDMVYDGINGKQLTFVCDSSYAYTPTVNKSFHVKDSFIYLFNSSDEEAFYPTFEIKPCGTDIVITNETDNGNSMFISKEFQGAINCELMMPMINNKIVPLSKLGWKDNDKLYWLKLLYGKNKLIFSGECDITFKLSFPRKVGLV